MGMSESGLASTLASNWIGRNSSVDSATALATYIDDEFQKATPSATNIDITTAAGTLVIPVTNMDGFDIITPSDIATAVSNYWALTITPTGVAVNCDNIDNVVNDATKIIGPITSGLTTLGMAAVPSSPNYLEFVTIILSNVKTILWTITESDSICNSTLNATVS